MDPIGRCEETLHEKMSNHVTPIIQRTLKGNPHTVPRQNENPGRLKTIYGMKVV